MSCDWLSPDLNPAPDWPRFVVYIFLFWLPDYVSSTSGVSAADSGYVANFFEYGGILGGVTSGVLVDLGLGGGLGEAGGVTP